MGKRKKKQNIQTEELNNNLLDSLDNQVLASIKLSNSPAPNEASKSPARIKKPNKYKIRGRLLKSGKGANPVTELYEWPTHLSPLDLRKLLSMLKKSLGCGGTLKDKVIEVQGDKIDQVTGLLAEHGFILIRSGG